MQQGRVLSLTPTFTFPQSSGEAFCRHRSIT